MGIFDDLLGDDKKKEKKKKDPSFTFDWLSDPPKTSRKPRKQKPAYKDLEAYSSDGEADEDGFFDETPL